LDLFNYSHVGPNFFRLEKNPKKEIKDDEYVGLIAVTRKVECEELAQQMINTKMVSIDESMNMIKQMIGKEQQLGVSLDNIKISLKCPITYTSIIVPAKGSKCTHVQVKTKLSYLSVLI
jgi:hypothetical protein